MSKTFTIATVFAVVLTLLTPHPSIAEPLKIDCVFERYAGIAGEGFDPSLAVISNTEMALVFVVDFEANNAYVVGNAGSAEVWPQVVDNGGLVLIESVPSGTVQVTAIDAAGNAVHSRHSMILGELVPSQYYGSCAFQ